jgi:hypothetical protein
MDIKSSLQTLEPSLQIDAVNLAQELLNISSAMSGGSRFNALSFKRLASITHKHIESLDDGSLDIDKLAEIRALTMISNDVAKVPMDLIKANASINKDQNTDQEEDSFAVWIKGGEGKVIGVAQS